MRFIIISDSKGKENGINKKVLNTLLNQSVKLNCEPDFIIIGGDSVAGSTKKEILSFQLNSFKNIVQMYYPTKAILPVIGNHEVNINPTDDSYEKIFSYIYSNLSPTDFLEDYNKTVYSFDFYDTRIIVLNAFHCGEIHKICNKQLDFLKEKASEDIKNKFVFVHSPAFPTGAHLGHCLDMYPDNRDNFWKIIDEYKVDIVFSAHEHNYSRRIIDSSFSTLNTKYTNSITQIITGGGGEKLRDKYKSKKGVVVPPIDIYHFTVVDVEETFIKVTAISSKGKKLDEFLLDKS